MSEPFKGRCPQGKKCWPTAQIDYSCENDCRPMWRKTGILLNRTDLRRVFGKVKRRTQKARAQSVMAMVRKMRTEAETKRQQKEQVKDSGLIVPASARRTMAQ